jgi:hypothetical protein
VIDGYRLVSAFGYPFIGIGKLEFGMKARPCAEVTQIFQGIVVRGDQVTKDIPAMIRGSGYIFTDVNFMFRFGDIDFSSLLKCLQDPVDAFGIAV